MSKHDDMFLVGDVVVQRLGGWPMGASLSEPCTMVDMNTSIWECDSNHVHAREVGWMHP